MTDTPNPRQPRQPRQQGGGFLPPSARSQTLPSPAPSTASSRAAARLPAPRSKPLAPGSRKEDYARDYVAQRLLHVSRRFVKKHGISASASASAAAGNLEDEAVVGGREAEDDAEGKGEGKRGEKEKEVPGYDSADQMCADLEEVVDVLWFSGTPSLQIPYLINVASALTTYLPSFKPPSPRPTFALLHKLDHCFASLLVGRDVKTRDPLPGFRTGASGPSRTDMVRVKSIADETRMLVAVAMSGEADVDVGEDEEYYGDAGGTTTGLRKQARGRLGGRDDDDQILDPFEAVIDPGEGVVYRLKPEGGDYRGFVADEETDDDDEDDFAAAGAVSIKMEEDQDEEEEGDSEDEAEAEGDGGDEDEFVDVAQPQIIPKRKVDDDVELSEDQAGEADPKKRMKIKGEEGQQHRKTSRDTRIGGGSSGLNHDDDDDDDGDGDGDGDQMKMKKEDENENTPLPDRKPSGSKNHSSNSSSPAPPRPPATTADSSKNEAQLGSNGHSTPNNTGNGTPRQQFHFALDEDEDDDSENETLPNTTTNIISSTSAIGAQQQQQRIIDDHEYDDDDDITNDEDEELHMNVAKVYEKTLMQLGNSLGESIVGDDDT